MLKFCPIWFGIISGYNSIRMLLVQLRKRTRLFFIILNTYSNVYELFHFNADLASGLTHCCMSWIQTLTSAPICWSDVSTSSSLCGSTWTSIDRFPMRGWRHIFSWCSIQLYVYCHIITIVHDYWVRIISFFFNKFVDRECVVVDLNGKIHRVWRIKKIINLYLCKKK